MKAVKVKFDLQMGSGTRQGGGQRQCLQEVQY